MTNISVIIIGAGPAGLSCALYLKRAAIPFLLLEKGAPGGKLLTIANIGNYPGFGDVTGTELATSILSSALASGVQVGFGDVVAVEKADSGFLVATNEEKYRCSAVVVATGLTNIATIKGEKEFSGRGVSYCATCDGPLFKNKVVAVYGSGDRALEEAIYLSGLAKEVCLLTPDHGYKGNPALLSSVESKPNVRVFPDSQVTEILGEGRVEKIVYQANGEKKELSLSAFFPLLGEKSASAFLSSLGVKMDKGFLEVDESQMSSVPGLFAAGDIVRKRLRQAITAASDGAVASSGVIAFLRERGKEHS
jgi:thioredoxin reductase (NADPH)